MKYLFSFALISSPSRICKRFSKKTRLIVAHGSDSELLNNSNNQSSSIKVLLKARFKNMNNNRKSGLVGLFIAILSIDSLSLD